MLVHLPVTAVTVPTQRNYLVTTMASTVPAPAPAPVSVADVPASTPSVRPPRLDAVDLLRGLVMVIMVLDHTRDFAFSGTLHFDPTDLTKTTPAIFFTRWITHFCAPAFVFLAGTGTMLQRQRGKPVNELSWFLFTRGLWLVFLEFTVVRTGWLWNVDYHFIGMAQVIWAIGCSMIIMAALVRLPVSVVFAIGLAITFLHDLVDPLLTRPFPAHPGLGADLLVIFLTRGRIQFGDHGPFMFFGYAVIPWLGVMALGYAIGTVYQWAPAERRRALVWGGAITTLGFVAWRVVNGYGDPFPWSRQPTPMLTVLDFLNVTKYPPSLDYLLMTLGPALLALAWFERIRPNPLSRVLVTFGRVPMFFYILQWPMAHGLTLLASLAAHKPTAYLSHEVFSGLAAPPDAGFTLAQTYLIWLTAVVLLYPLCRWYANIKQTHRWWWLSYI
jgi:uncharacterized membrane protein